MSIDREEDNPQGLEHDFSHRRYSDEALGLRITEKFLAEVSRSMLRDTPEMFDIREIKESLSKLKGLMEASDTADRFEIESTLRTGLDSWRDHIEQRDLAIEAFEIRRFCDSVRRSLDISVFLALARFYHQIPLSRNSQSKFDLVITRAFESSRGGNARTSKFNRQEIADRIRAQYNAWDAGDALQPVENESKDRAIAGFADFIAQAESVNEFETLIDSNIFERIRAFKRELGSSYFEPDCVAAAIECNIVVGNVFELLFSRLNSSLHERLSSQFDFAGAFLDASVESDSVVFDVLKGLDLTHDELEFADQPDSLRLFRSLLRQPAAVEPERKPEETDEILDEVAEDEIEERPLLIKERLARELETISNQRPDIALLRNCMRRHESLDVLDLNDFLFDENDQPDVFGRRALAAMLCLEEFKENDLKSNKTLETEVSDEIVAMLHFAERVGEDLAEEVRAAEQSRQNRLLTITNSLLNCRLQVERAVVRFAAPVEEIVELPPENEIQVELPFLESFEITRAPFWDSNRWLVAATILVMFVCSGLLLLSGQSYNAAPLPEDVEEVTVSRLPDSAHIEQAFRKNDTLFVSARNTWETMSEFERRAALQKMVELEFKKPLQTVIVIDGTGRPLGDLSAAGITIHDEPIMTKE